MNRQYVLSPEPNLAMGLRNFSWRMHSNQATLEWDWPIERDTRFALVFECEDENPDIAKLIEEKHPHEIVPRDLSSQFAAAITRDRCKFLLSPAYFDENNTVVVCHPTVQSDWIYKRAVVDARAVYKPVTLGQYKRVDLHVKVKDSSRLDHLITVLTYDVLENGGRVATYSFDEQSLAEPGHMYIKKEQTIRFTIREDARHLFDLKQH
ncbi:MAG: hypothetical protein FWC78_03770 [Defluviitaleaceae bacterium]|nr:hypothetical protein [Defluviitaleaceae bacterium]